MSSGLTGNRLPEYQDDARSKKTKKVLRKLREAGPVMNAPDLEADKSGDIKKEKKLLENLGYGKSSSKDSGDRRKKKRKTEKSRR